MSSRQRRRQSKTARTRCVSCEARKARFRYRGEVRADRDHTLCFECYRAEVNRARARRLGQRPAATRPTPDGQDLAAAGVSSLAHRQRMLDHLRRQAAVVS